MPQKRSICNQIMIEDISEKQNFAVTIADLNMCLEVCNGYNKSRYCVNFSSRSSDDREIGFAFPTRVWVGRVRATIRCVRIDKKVPKVPQNITEHRAPLHVVLLWHSEQYSNSSDTLSRRSCAGELAVPRKRTTFRDILAVPRGAQPILSITSNVHTPCISIKRPALFRPTWHSKLNNKLSCWLVCDDTKFMKFLTALHDGENRFLFVNSK